MTPSMVTPALQIYPGDGNDTIYAGSEGGTLNGDAGNDTIHGGGTYDFLYGGDGNDLLYGGSSVDYIYGGAGNDFISGGGGSDYMTSGTGADTFYFDHTTAFSSAVTITDFNTSDGDKIDIHDLLTGFDPDTSALTDFVHVTASGSNAIVSVDADGPGSGST